MYVGNDLGFYGGLESMWGFGETQPLIVDPKQYIPQKYDIMNADQASLYLKHPAGRKPPKKKAKKGSVYWTASGPQYSRKKIKGGKKAEKVLAPKIKFRPNIEIVRDLPKIEVTPIPGQQTPPKASPKAKPTPKAKPKILEGFSEFKKGGLLPLLVLGLLIVGLVSYNKF